MPTLKAKPDCCEEAALGIPFYAPCNKPATNIVGWKGRSDTPIRMCDFCTNHNTHNRGGYIVRPYQAQEGVPVSNTQIPASNRDVQPSDNRRGEAEKIDYAGIETERLTNEYAGLRATLNRLKGEAAAIPEITDDETMTRAGGVIKRLRDLRAEIEKTRVVETEPHLRRKNAGDALFGSWYDEIQPDKKPGQRPKPGLIDDLQTNINIHQDRKEAAERARREEAERIARAEREAAETKARQEREAAERAQRAADEAAQKAERARTEVTRAAAADAARVAAEAAAARAAQAKSAEINAEKANEKHQDARIDTLAKSADLVRTQGNTSEGGGVLNTVATEKIAELIDRSELDDEAKLALFEQFTDAEVAKAVRAYANKTFFRSALKGCLITIRKKGVTR